MVELRPMTESEYDAYLSSAVPSYAEAKVLSGNWSEQIAVDRARDEFAELLPQGPGTPGQYLYAITEAPLGDAVGAVWFEVQSETGIAKAYVNDLIIKPEHRRKGHATEAMRLVEDEARRMGCTDLALHVFAHNKEAVALYRILGMEITNLVMAKGL